MGFFRKKDKYDDIDMTLLEDDDFFIGTKKSAINAPKPNSLTADEIVGATSEDFFILEESPIESLRKKMIARKAPVAEIKAQEDEEEIQSFFNIDSSFLDTKNQTEPTEEIIISPADIVMESDETDAKADVQEPETQSQEESLLENCLPFIMDGNNGEYIPSDKPSYTLDSVASILGIEEPKKVLIEQPTEEKDTQEKTMVFKAIEDTGNLPDISDIDTKTKNSVQKDISSTATIPVIIPDEMISATRDIDISDEFLQNKSTAELGISEEQILQEYQTFTPEFEYHGKSNRKKIKIKLLKERRSRFLKFLTSMLGLLILGFLALPVFSDNMLSFSASLAVFASIGLLLPLICNYDIFYSLGSIFTKRTSAEAGIALSVLVSTISIILSFAKTLAGEVFYSIALMTVLSLVFRSYFRFRRSQYIYTNFLRISTDSDKYGITLIDDVPTTFAMARKAIDGDVLIAAAKRTRTVKNFIKNSTFDIDFDGRAKLFFIIGISLSLLAGVAFGFYRNNLMTGIITVCVFTSLFAPLTSLACSILPLSSAASHLNRYGAVLSGLRAARQIEAANACVISCDELFPKGSIRLVNMKVMAQNNLEETIACACAITTSIKSPLAPVFKTVMETNKTIKTPVADSIKYEERLGISGWVGNKRMFIGNRALMLAHEIPVPDAEKDKKLMREGYFPVYVACDGKACALLVLKYIPKPDIAKELDRISAMGLTILVNNCDQNISEEMICDYFDIYSDSVKIMSSSGVHMYKTATSFEESMNAGAVIKSGAAAMAATVYCANRVKRANILLQIAHIISIVLGVIIFSYIVFGSVYVNCIYVAVYQLVCFILSGIAYLFTKP